MSSQDSSYTGLAGVRVGADSEVLNRGELLLRGALAVGGLYGLGMAGAYLQRALAASTGGDLEILNFVLKFEHLEVDFFEVAKQRLALSGELKSLVAQVAREERQQVEAVAAEIEKLGGKPIAKGSYGFAYRGEYEFLRLGREIEDAVIAAYNGAIPMLQSRSLRALIGSIVQVEGRHAAALGIQREEEPAPAAFEISRRKYDALDSMQRFAGPAIYE